MTMNESDVVFVPMPDATQDAMREALHELAPPAFAPGFDARVLARLQAERQRAVTELAITRQFWRVAIPAAAAAVLMIAIAARHDSDVVADSVSLATWYSLSADPTVQP